MTRVDKAKVRQAFAQASAHYDDFAYLQRTVAGELMQRSGVERLAGRVVDLGCGTGFLTHKLLQLGGYEQLFALDLALPMLHQARQRLATAAYYICADIEQLSLQTQSMDFIFSSLALQWCLALPSTLQDLHRVLKPGAKLAFATFGPATLQELKQAWAAVDDYPHVNDFCSVAELQNHLQPALWQQVQMSSQVYHCRYASVLALMRELKGIGAHNVSTGRQQQLMGKEHWHKMLAAYPLTDATVFASYEVIWVIAEAR